MNATEVCCGGPMVARRGIDYETGEWMVRRICPKCRAVTEWEPECGYEDGRAAVAES